MKAPAHVLKALGLKESDVLYARQTDGEWIITTNTARKYRTSVTPPPPPPDEVDTQPAEQPKETPKPPKRKKKQWVQQP
jgi:hypothetical protein